MEPTLTDADLEELRELLRELLERRTGPLPRDLLARFAGLGAARAGLTIDLAAAEVLGTPVVVLRDPVTPDPCLATLTPREREVAALVATGLRNRDVALALGISVATVKDHVHRILQRTGLDSRTAIAVAWRGERRGGDGSPSR